MYGRYQRSQVFRNIWNVLNSEHFVIEHLFIAERWSCRNGVCNRLCRASVSNTHVKLYITKQLFDISVRESVEGFKTEVTMHYYLGMYCLQPVDQACL